MTMLPRPVLWFTTVACGLIALGATGIAGAAEPSAEPPDLTRGARVDRSLTYNLGATGLRGWIHTRPATHFDGVQGRTTTSSRQILVTHVGSGSPADGVMEPGDVILGVDGGRFSDDARTSLAVAIQKAESEAGGGVLRLTRWRAGEVEEVRLSLRVLGTYAATAPYDCPKSRRILDEACDVLVREPLTEDLFGAVNGLALLASGRPEVLPRVAEFARRLAAGAPAAVRDDMRTWECGYRTIFLSEYHLLAGDREVLPAIETLTLALAKGQGRYGTFGHGFSEPAADGGLHGPIPPYGPVNAAGLVGNLAIVMGRRCGVADPEVAAAIDRGSRFFGYYVGKGAIPYGEHMPWPHHDNNGKNAMAAAFFALQGDRPEESRFFATMVTASFRNREYGHTGQGFSYLWGGPGAGMGGPAAAAAFFREASWHLDLVRRCDGSFTYDGSEQFGPGSTDDDTYFGKSGYYGLSPTASYVLTYALPLRAICLTGRTADDSQWLDDGDVAAAVASGRFDLDRETMPIDGLVAALGDWSPVARGWAAEELSRRPEAKRLVPQLIALAEGPDPRVRQGACEALGRLRAPEALPVLVRLLVHDDRWLRTKAARALEGMGDAARPVVPDMLAAVARTAEPLEPIAWADPIQLTHGELAATLFKGLLRSSIDDVDRGLLHPAIRAVSRNADGMARATLTHLLEHQLGVEDVRALGPDILAAATAPCPADTMFRNEIRMAAFRALARYRFREGIEAGVLIARTQGGHGSETRTGEIMRELVGYGAAAVGIVPELEDLIRFFKAECAAGGFPEGPLNDARIDAVKEAIAAIESAAESPTLRTLATEEPGSPGTVRLQEP
ncbi:MAG: HEAT repeat domain-containing protein [Planctomycetes bacterium]|nr:HEAT repeat domain-containing protein [Planctomycetota bacterium]